MDASRWRQLKRLLDEALSRAPHERAAFLDQACAGDRDLRAEVESLLAHEHSDSLVGAPLRAAFEASLEDADANLAGQHIGPYRLEEHIAHGGMGVVYRAVRDDGVFHKRVAVKIVREGMATADVLRRFRNERRILAAIDHPNIAGVIDGGSTESGRPYFVMEYVDGTPINEYCDANRLTIRERLELFMAVCDAVQFAHERQVVHRDIKPGNVLVKVDGTPKLLDFGIARMLTPDDAESTIEPTTFDSRVMTPGFASPEQVMGRPVTPASDVYSLAVLLYLLLSGRLPYEVTTTSAVEIERIVSETQPARLAVGLALSNRAADARGTTPVKLRRQLTGDLEKIIGTALRKDARDRYATAGELADDIRHFLDGRPVRARGNTVGYRLTLAARSKQSRRRAAVAGSVVLAAAAAVALWWSSQLAGRSGPMFPFSLGARAPLGLQPGLELYPMLSPDGELLAFSAGPDHQLDVFVRRLSDGRTVNVTSSLDGHHMGPRWSPEGTRLMFQTERPTSLDVHVVQIGNAFAAGATFDAVSLVSQPVREPMSPTWSPEGDAVAYAADSPDDTDGWADSIVVLSLIDGSRRTITEAFRPHSLRWSPDGSRLAYVESNPPFMFSGSALFNVAASAVWVTPIEGGEPARITEEDNVNASPDWTPDSAALLYPSNREGTMDIYYQPIASSGAPVGPATRLTTGLEAHSLSLARDGTTLVYSTYETDSNIWTIPIPRVGPVSFSEARQVTSGRQLIEGVDVSDDGLWLVFDSNRSGNADIWRYRLADDWMERLTTDPGQDVMPQFSPDGREVVFYSFRDGNREVYTVSVEQKTEQRLTRSPAHDLFPGWSPDGNEVLFSSTGNAEGLYVVTRPQRDAEWGAPRQLIADAWGEGRWSPSGGEIAQLGPPHRLLKVEDEVTGSVELGGSVTSLGGFAWSKDGTLYAHQRVVGQPAFWEIPPDGSEPSLLVYSERPLYLREVFATDGRMFYFTVHRRESSMWITPLEWRR